LIRPSTGKSGIPAFVTGPIYDQTYQTVFNGTGTGGAVTYRRSQQPAARVNQNWNLSVQRSLTSSMVLSLAYVRQQRVNSWLARAVGLCQNQIDPKYLVLGTLA